MTIILLFVIINYCMEGTEGDYAKLVSCTNKPPPGVIANSVWVMLMLWIITLEWVDLQLIVKRFYNCTTRTSIPLYLVLEMR